MKPLMMSLLKRNGLFTVGFVVLLFGVSRFPSVDRIPLPVVQVGFFCGLLWANSILFKRGRRILPVVLSLFLFAVLGLALGIVSIPYNRGLVDRQFTAQGFQMVRGCNGGAAVGADGQVHQFEQLLEMATNSPTTDTDIIIELKKGYALAQEKAKVLGDYCGKAGHVDRHPWKTNWAGLNEIIKVNQEKLYQ